MRMLRLPLWACVLLAPFAACAIMRAVAWDARLAVGPTANTFEAFARDNAPPAQLALTEVRRRRYIVWTPPTTGHAVLLRLGSGPPIYVFDDAGTLVGWSPTTGDGKFRMLDASHRQRAITVQGALRLIEATDRDAHPN